MALQQPPSNHLLSYYLARNSPPELAEKVAGGADDLDNLKVELAAPRAMLSVALVVAVVAAAVGVVVVAVVATATAATAAAAAAAAVPLNNIRAALEARLVPPIRLPLNDPLSDFLGRLIPLAVGSTAQLVPSGMFTRSELATN